MSVVLLRRTLSAILALFLPASVLALPPQERLVVVGAGFTDSWDTEFVLANPGNDEVGAWIGQIPFSPGCLHCPGWMRFVPPNGTTKTSARDVLASFGSPGVRMLYVEPLSGSAQPTVSARVVNRSRPAQAAELPVVRYATIEALNPTVLSFPGATSGSGYRSNLVISEVSRRLGSGLSILIEAYSLFGDRVGTAVVLELPPGGSLFLVDVLAQLGTSAPGQIRVTKIAGSGLMWGVLATISANGGLSIALGAAPAGGVFRESSVPTPGSSPAGVVHDGFDLWFTELEGNKIGRIDRDRGGVITEYPIPTPDSGPTSIVMKPLGTTREVWFTEFRGNKIGRLTQNGVLTEYPLPSPASGPRGIDRDLWFTEFKGNRIGQITQDGTITEFPIPTPDSGPSGIVVGPNGTHWFTEYRANKIGRITALGAVTEFEIPTPDSGPLEIAQVGHDFWFTESRTNKIGRITSEGVITEFSLPTPSAGPAGITAGPDQEVWFTETLANQIGRITRDGTITEYRIPTPGADPIGLTRDGLGIWFTESGTGKIGYLVRDVLVIAGAGYTPYWDTELAFANPQAYPLGIWAGASPVAPEVCAGSCPGIFAAVVPFGTTYRSFAATPFASTGVGTRFVVPLTGVDPPSVSARAIGRSPGSSADLPVVRLSTIEAMNPTVLTFPGAARGTGVRSNLILSMLSEAGAVSAVIEAFSSQGDALGSLPLQLTGNVRERFLYDVLAQLGVSSLEAGQIRVTKTGGNGLMWGLLTTVHADGRLTVSLGANP